MAKSTIVAAIFTLFLFSCAASKKTLEGSINDQEPSLKVSLNVVPFIEIQQVCQDRVILDFQIWYEAYMPKYLQKHSFVPAFDIQNNLLTGVDNHVNQLKNYIKLLEDQKEDMKKFAPLFLDIKISKLIDDINTSLAAPKKRPNPFAQAEEQEKLKANHGHYLPELIQDFNKKTVDTDLISAIGGAYRADWDNKHPTLEDPISKKVEELATPLRDTLRLIIEVFTDPNGLIYKELGKNKPNIIHFYAVFKFLLTPKERKAEIADKLVPNKQYKETEKPGFLCGPIFNKLTEKPHSFVNAINRDRFLMLNDPDTDLETIHKAAQPIFFSSEFPNEMDSDPKKLGLDDPLWNKLTEDPKARQERKKANLDRLLYQVYVLARVDGTIPAGEPLTNQEILRKLKDWVEATDAFDAELPIVSESEPLTEEDIEKAPKESEKSDPKNRFQQLIPAPVFKRNYVPLLSHICGKLNDCTFAEEAKKPELIAKFEKFGNFDDMNKDKALASLIPTEILDAIKDKLADKKVAELDKDLDSYLDDFEPFTEEEEEDLAGQNFSGKFESPKIKSPKKQTKTEQEGELLEDIPEEIVIEEDVTPSLVQQKSFKQLQDDGIVVKCPATVEPMRVKSKANRVKQAKVDAINPLLNQFIPVDTAITPEGKKFVDKLLDKAENADEPAKEATIKTLILKVIMQRLKERQDKAEEPKNEMTIIDHVNKRLVDRLLNSFSFLDTKGIRNFFEKERNQAGRMRFDSENQLDQKFYKFDMIFFYFFAAESQAIRHKSEGKSKDVLSKDVVEIAKANKAINERFQLGLTSQLEIKNKLKSIVYNNVALLERMPAYEFFVSFLDFFNYFEIIESKAEAEYMNYSEVFMNFYKFLVRVRTTIGYKIETPHPFVLAQLERCLVYTEDVVVTSLNMVDEVCVMSHRKYAEMYYFYKLYLVANKKVEGINLLPYQGRKFDTHVRAFINFADQNSKFNSVLTEVCKTVSDVPICTTWTLYTSLIGYLHDRSEASDSIVPAFKNAYAQESSAVKFAVLGAFESVYSSVSNGNQINWARYQQMVFELKRNKIDVTKFDNNDLELLSKYYIRTYKKLIFTPEEARVSQVVRRILSIVPNNESTETFMNFIPHYNTYYHFDGAKLFLLLSQTPEEFRTIAEATINFNQGHNLLEMNNLQTHRDMINLIKIAAAADDDVKIMHQIKKYIAEDYEKTKGRSRICFESELRNDGLDADEESLLDDLLSELAADGVSVEDKTGSLLEEELAKPNTEPKLIVTEQVIKIQVDSESRIAQSLGLKLDEENVVILNEGENIADYQKAIEGKIKLNEEKLTPAELQQALDLKAQFAQALGNQMTELQNNPIDTHSGILSNPSSPTNQQKDKKFKRKNGKHLI